MDLPTFTGKLAALTLLPADVRTYAAEVSPQLSDAERAELMAGIEKEYARIETLEKERTELYAGAEKKLKEIVKKNMPAIRREVEQAQQSSAEDAATKQLDDHA